MFLHLSFRFFRIDVSLLHFFFKLHNFTPYFSTFILILPLLPRIASTGMQNGPERAILRIPARALFPYLRYASSTIPAILRVRLMMP